MTESSRYDWAEHLIWMEGGAPPAQTIEPRRWPGVLVATALAAAAYLVASQSRWLDPILVAMILGLIAGNLFSGNALAAGMSVAVKKWLPVGIVLLGARLDFFDVLRLGATGVVMSVAVVGAGFALVFGLRRFWRLEKSFALLLAVGTAICGGTAIVAIAPLVRARERDIFLGVGLVTILGLVGMIALPPLAAALDLSQREFGILAGLTIHQTPQVVASGFAYGEEAGQVATIVKLARVCLLAPVAIFIGWWFVRGSEAATARPWWQFLPGFAFGFLALALVRTLGWLPELTLSWEKAAISADTTLILKYVAGFFLATGMVAVGFQTRFAQFRGVGWRPAIGAAVASLVIAAGVLMILMFTAI